MMKQIRFDRNKELDTVAGWFRADFGTRQDLQVVGEPGLRRVLKLKINGDDGARLERSHPGWVLERNEQCGDILGSTLKDERG